MLVGLIATDDDVNFLIKHFDDNGMKMLSTLPPCTTRTCCLNRTASFVINKSSNYTYVVGALFKNMICK
jgi:hypothetical protein